MNKTQLETLKTLLSVTGIDILKDANPNNCIKINDIVKLKFIDFNSEEIKNEFFNTYNNGELNHFISESPTMAQEVLKYIDFIPFQGMLVLFDNVLGLQINPNVSLSVVAVIIHKKNISILFNVCGRQLLMIRMFEDNMYVVNHDAFKTYFSNELLKTDLFTFMQLSPLIVFKVIERLTKYEIDSVRLNSMKLDSINRKLKKGCRIPPNAFYTINVGKAKPIPIKEPESKLEPKPEIKNSEYSYRFDVRGHWAHRVTRGTEKNQYLLTDQKNRHIITKKNYNDHPKEIIDYIEARKISIGDGEWVSVLKYWVPEHVKGPEDKVYVPAVHAYS